MVYSVFIAIYGKIGDGLLFDQHQLWIMGLLNIMNGLLLLWVKNSNINSNINPI